MSWTFNATLGTEVILPVAPKRVTIQFTADIKEIPIPAVKSIIVSLGRKVDKLMLEGAISEAGQTAAQLQAAYLDKLEALVYTEVTLAAPDTRYDASDWVMTMFRYVESGGFTTSFQYKIELIKGSSVEVIT